MSEIVISDQNLKPSGKMALPIPLDESAINVATVHQIVKATLAGRRQGTACTKNRAQVRGGGAKPFKQKGTGRARQGSKRAPIQVGGGVVFGPTPRSYQQKVNKKMRLNGLRSVLADKKVAEKLFVLEKFEFTGKTSEVFNFLNKNSLPSALFVVDSPDSVTIRATNNLPNAETITAEQFSVYSAIRYHALIFEKAALEKLFKRFEDK